MRFIKQSLQFIQLLQSEVGSAPPRFDRRTGILVFGAQIQGFRAGG